MQISTTTAPFQLNGRIALALVTAAVASAGVIGAAGHTESSISASGAASAPVTESRAADPLRVKSLSTTEPAVLAAPKSADPLISKSLR